MPCSKNPTGEYGWSGGGGGARGGGCCTARRMLQMHYICMCIYTYRYIFIIKRWDEMRWDEIGKVECDEDQGEFRCSTSDVTFRCIDVSHRCDDFVDCYKKEDEMNCEPSVTVRTPTARTHGEWNTHCINTYRTHTAWTHGEWNTHSTNTYRTHSEHMVSTHHEHMVGVTHT